MREMQKLQETWGLSLSWEGLLEEEMSNHFIITDSEIQWTRGSWQAIVHRVAKGQTQLSD